MARSRKRESSEPDWPPDRTLHLLKQQLDELQKLRGRTWRDAEREEDEWQQFTANLIIHGFGDGSQNLSNFYFARSAGVHNMMGISDHQRQLNFQERIEKFQATLNSSIRELEAIMPEARPEEAIPSQGPVTTEFPARTSVSVLISHSSKDAALAGALIDLLRSGLGLLANQIRCSSVDGYRLPAGVDTNDQLRREIKTVKVLIGLLTPNSLSSTYVLFELGARWGAELFMIPLLARIRPEDMRGPHGVLNALSCESEAQLIQLVEDIGRELNLSPQSAASFLTQVHAVKTLSESIAAPAATQNGARDQRHAPSPNPERDFKMSLKVEGTPPSQVLKVTATQSVTVSRLEYMLTDEACIVGEDVTFEGETFEVPLRDDSLIKLFNTPRSDMHHYDHSGPMKLGLTVSIGGRTQQYILPARLEIQMQGSTVYRQVIGSKDFYGISG